MDTKQIVSFGLLLFLLFLILEVFVKIEEGFNEIANVTKPVVYTYNRKTVEERIVSSSGKYGGILLKLAYCESRFDPAALHWNQNGSIDVGVLQFNNKAHPEVTTECALSVECSVARAVEMLDKNDGHSWACWKLI